ncbi:hypothetical protein JHK85_035077 [Glycine max]|uniref:Uncharacterized protein n=2 Tax=Glycine subgen. Soja TaxID=1462606 RepID=A0A0R0HJW3_SOYBN|nr:hypothetical protein JHK85_035077 [Glycine max]KAG4986747.1 hypothetical protein JHK86_034438 [Glycine max]RZB76614.1 hypothetical protein D0Y65_034862 [Glycine soja]
MTQMVLLRSPPVTRRRGRRGVGEVAGSATAECAAVCCCVPLTVMDMVVLATYKLPACLLKKAMHKRKRRLLQKKKKKTEALLDHGPVTADNAGPGPKLEDHLAKEVAEEKLEASRLEAEMWAQFNGTGFWRSASQRYQQQQTGQIKPIINLPIEPLTYYIDQVTDRVGFPNYG